MRPTSRTPTDMMASATTARRGMLLVVVLAIISVLSLLGASFTFQMNADFAGVKALGDLQQARLACESGMDRVVLLLRKFRTDIDEWYNNPDIFRRQLVWAPDKEGGSTSLVDQEKIEGQPAWRFSVVTFKRGREGEDAEMRYGITDEASKINLNVAQRGQLLKLFEQFKTEHVVPQELADALIDWRDTDNEPNSGTGAESSYYMRMNPRYRAKNRGLQTVEELLMVRGFDGQLLYGEDYNRNGYLDDNEKDGTEGSCPPDNGDSILDEGLLSFVTVYSWDWNSANDNKQRININKTKFGEPDDLPEYLVEELRPEVMEYIAEAQQRGYTFRSVGELYGLEVWEDGTSNYSEAWKEYTNELVMADGLRSVDEEGEASSSEMVDDGSEDGSDTDDRSTDDDADEDIDADGDDEEDSRSDDEKKSDDRRRRELNERDASERDDSRRGRDRERDRDRGRDRSGDDEEEVADNSEGSAVSEAEEGASSEAEGGAASPKTKGTPIISPVSGEDMEVIMDRLTVSSQPAFVGLININTASRVVLRTIVGLSEDEVESIVTRRQQLSGPEKATTAWLVTSGALSPSTFAVVSNHLTARSIQFSIDVVGFADHVGAAKRFQALVEIRGELSQMLYCRDVTGLGIGYPVWDDERSEGFGFSNR